MRPRLGPVPLLVLVALVSLVAGSLGPAAASGLTSHAVKKIAARVVAKKAPTLSVAHASSADNATRVGGFSAGQLRTTGYSYSLPDNGPFAVRTWTFPGLPKGTYLASYAMLVNSTSGDRISCSFAPDSLAPDYQAATNNVAALSASSIVTVTTTIGLRCSTTGTSFEVNPYWGDTVSFVPIDNLVTGTPVGGP